MIQQVKFIAFDDDEVHGGIKLDDGRVVCGCCGGIFEADELVIIHRYNFWVDLTMDIMSE